ncbi:taurine catabolism dioxygenase [Mycena olivaceomarginata]|nr:taurine catabolism dioxygenase [Mycena olivaceomarginata]
MHAVIAPINIFPSCCLPSISSIAQRDETPAIGTRFLDPTTAQLSQWLTDANSDNIIRELAIWSLDVAWYSSLSRISESTSRNSSSSMGELTGRPASSSLHKHPISAQTPELGKDVSVISSMGCVVFIVKCRNISSGPPVPADYSILKMLTIPEAYDKLSPTFAKFLEGLTAIHSGEFFVPAMAAQLGLPIQDNRGHPENSGSHLTAIQTHPLTGFKSLYVDKSSIYYRIVELSAEESADVLAYLTRHLGEPRSAGPSSLGANGVAIWDNRCVLHTATNDYGSKPREGNRVVGIGEKPFFDPSSVSRRETSALGVKL